jgi:hypothetical protein
MLHTTGKHSLVCPLAEVVSVGQMVLDLDLKDFGNFATIEPQSRILPWTNDL